MTVVPPAEPFIGQQDEGHRQIRRAAASLRAAWFRLGPMGRDGEGWNKLTLGLVLLTILVVIATFADYGITWDEDVHNWYGVFVLDYYLSLFKDARCLNWLNLYNYGAAFDTIAALLNRFSPFGTYETRHLLNGLIGVLGLIGCWKLGRTLGGPRAGFIGALFLILTPNYYGQMFNNPKDIPFAVGMVWSIYYIVRILPLLPRPKWSLLVKLGVAAGLAMGVRVGGLLVFCYLGVLLGGWILWRAVELRSLRATSGEAWTALWRVVLPTVVVAYPVMLLFWPWAQISPIENPLRALAFFSHETFPYRTLFAGKYFPATDLPWAYLPTYIVLALPEIVLVLALVAPVIAYVLARGMPRPALRDWVLRHSLVALAIIFPVAYAVEIKAVLFDGMRHFIFILPLIAVVAAQAADHLLDWLTKFEYRRPIYAAIAALRRRACLGDGDAPSQRIRLLQRLHRRRRRGAGAVQARLLGELLRRSGRRARGLPPGAVRPRLHGA